MEPPELTPAEFDGARRNRYRPRLPWARIGFVLLVIAAIAGAYFWRQKFRADEVRERMRTQHAEHVAPILDELDAIRRDVEGRALFAKTGAANRLVEAELPLSALHDKNVIYLKTRVADLASEEALRAAIASESEDAIGACLGLELTSLSALSEVPEVLTAKWLSRADETNDMQRLSVREEQLTRAIERELPALKERIPVDYFLLLVIQGTSRLRDPVDVFLWDLGQDKLVLRSRTENRGRLITVRTQKSPESRSTEVADDPIVTADCSIAAHIKAQLGEPTMDLATPD
jgi:hypothetical protein